MSGSFKASDVIDHKSFGIGFVSKAILPNKIEVLFRQGSKLLICGPHPKMQHDLSSAIAQSQAKKAKAKRLGHLATWSWSNSANNEKEENNEGWGGDEPVWPVDRGDSDHGDMSQDYS